MIRKIFGRKPTASPSPPAEESINLSTKDMAQYCKAMAKRRGYPEDSWDMIAGRVRFLEQRGLPGFLALAREMLSHPNESLSERGSDRRPDGAIGGRCPFISGIMIEQHIDTYLTLAPGQARILPAPSNPVLLLPKLALLAGPRGVIIRASWFLAKENVAMTLVDGHRAVHFGPPDPFFHSDQVALSRFAEETETPPAPLRAAHIDTFAVPAAMLRRITHYVETGQ